MTAPKKSLGQNFLMHRQTAERIVVAAGVGAGDVVLEIGPGTGMLTHALLGAGAQVTAVEADGELATGLEERFAGEIREGRLELAHADIRAFNPTLLAMPYALVANIPYYITGEIIRTFLTATHKPSSMTLLVQKEVAERIARSKKESILSIAVKVYGTPRYRFTVPRGAFRPAPNVDSAVLTISGIHNPFSSEHAEERFFEILHAGFAHKRKLLIRNLEAVADPEHVRSAFKECALSERARAEDVPFDVWHALVSKL